MATPQLENGYTRIADEIMNALIAYRLPGEQVQCVLFIIKKTYGFNKIWDMISNSQFVEATGMAKQSVGRAINGLVDKNIVNKKVDNYIPSYRFNKNYKKWKLSTKRCTVNKKVLKGLKSSTKKLPTIDNITIDMFKFKKKVGIPKNIYLTDRMKSYIVGQGCEENNHAKQLFEDFKNYHGAKGTKWEDWTLTFFTWVRNDKKYYNSDKYVIKIYDK